MTYARKKTLFLQRQDWKKCIRPKLRSVLEVLTQLGPTPAVVGLHQSRPTIVVSIQFLFPSANQCMTLVMLNRQRSLFINQVGL